MPDLDNLTQFYEAVRADGAINSTLDVHNTPNPNVKHLVGRSATGEIISMVLDGRPFLDRPEHITMTAAFADRESLIRYAGPFVLATPRAKFYAKSRPGQDPDRRLPRFEAVVVLDDHRPDDPANRDHAAELLVSLDPRFAKWYAAANRWMTRGEFAELVDDSLEQVTQPPHADLLELVQLIRGRKTTEFEDGERLANGQRSVSAIETVQVNGTPTKRKGPATGIPDRLLITCPVFDGGDPVAFPLRFRYRVEDDNSITFKMLFSDIDTFLRAQCAQYVAPIEAALGLEVMWIR